MANRLVGIFGALWAVAGLLGILVWAIVHLMNRAIEAYETGLSTAQWWITAAIVVFMAYTEGYRGFQGSFSPRTAHRVRHLIDHPDGLRSLLAPLYAMGFFHATRRIKVTTYALTIGIVVLVLLIQQLDQPWRGMIDAGVVVGLAWGVASLVWCFAAVLSRRGAETG